MTAAAVPAQAEAPDDGRRELRGAPRQGRVAPREGGDAEAVALLEQLAADLAGAGSFPLAVAVRHQISAWTSGPPISQTAARIGEAMARQREASADRSRPRPGGPPRSHPVPEGLERSRFFAEMTSEEIAGFIASTERRTFGPGEVVLEQGKEGRSLFILTRGVLRVETIGAAGGTLRMGVLTMGDVFGEVAFLTGRPAHGDGDRRDRGRVPRDRARGLDGHPREAPARPEGPGGGPPGACPVRRRRHPRGPAPAERSRRDLNGDTGHREVRRPAARREERGRDGLRGPVAAGPHPGPPRDRLGGAGPRDRGAADRREQAGLRRRPLRGQGPVAGPRPRQPARRRRARGSSGTRRGASRSPTSSRSSSARRRSPSRRSTRRA